VRRRPNGVVGLTSGHLFCVTCTFECDRPFLRPRPEVESHLFRIAQEAVNNAITHGKADRIENSPGSKGGQGLLCIKDNGVGMPVEAPAPEGAGLHTMAYRARLIGGSLEVRRRVPREKPDHDPPCFPPRENPPPQNQAVAPMLLLRACGTVLDPVKRQARALGLGFAVALVPEMDLEWSGHRARRPVRVVVPAGSSKRVTSLPPAT
jgi:hypothetical protein